MFKFFLTTQEFYIIFSALKKIFENDKIKRDEPLQLIVRDMAINKGEVNNIISREFIFDNNKAIKIVESIDNIENAYFIKFNSEIFENLSPLDIEYIKQIKFYKYVSTMKVFQLGFYNGDLTLSDDDLRYIDNNRKLLQDMATKEESLGKKISKKVKELLFSEQNINYYIDLLTLDNNLGKKYQVEYFGEDIRIIFKKKKKKIEPIFSKEEYELVNDKIKEINIAKFKALKMA